MTPKSARETYATTKMHGACSVKGRQPLLLSLGLVGFWDNIEGWVGHTDPHKRMRVEHTTA